jgi:hypothetical protein
LSAAVRGARQRSFDEGLDSLFTLLDNNLFITMCFPVLAALICSRHIVSLTPLRDINAIDEKFDTENMNTTKNNRRDNFNDGITKTLRSAAPPSLSLQYSAREILSHNNSRTDHQKNVVRTMINASNKNSSYVLPILPSALEEVLVTCTAVKEEVGSRKSRRRRR